jgi:hypothetical protein
VSYSSLGAEHAGVLEILQKRAAAARLLELHPQIVRHAHAPAIAVFEKQIAPNAAG